MLIYVNQKGTSGNTLLSPLYWFLVGYKVLECVAAKFEISLSEAQQPKNKVEMPHPCFLNFL
jgi:hypothetical protein